MSNLNPETSDQITPEQQAYNQLVELHRQLPEVVVEDNFRSTRAESWTDTTTLTLTKINKSDHINVKVVFQGLERCYFEAKPNGLEWYRFPSVRITLGDLTMINEDIRSRSRGHTENYRFIVPAVDWVRRIHQTGQYIEPFTIQVAGDR